MKKRGINNALHNIKKRDKTQSQTGSNAEQRFRESLTKWGYRGVAETVFRTCPISREKKATQKIAKALGLDVVFFKYC